jgi:hypothetical protein
VIHSVDGTINTGDGFDPQLKYQITNLSLTFADPDVVLDLVMNDQILVDITLFLIRFVLIIGI